MADCVDNSCPFRTNTTSNPYHCDCAMCQNRTNTVLIISNHTLTEEELKVWNKRVDNG